MKSLLKEPLLHFLLIGAGLFFLHGLKGNPAPPTAGQMYQEPKVVSVSLGDIDLLEQTFKKTWWRQPNPEERDSLIDNFIRDEIYYREARALGLDRQDSVVRLRMRRHMEFFFEDISSQAEPTDNELITFMKENSERYQIDPQIAFRHIYLGEYQTAAENEKKAQQIRDRLAAGAEPATLGKPFLYDLEIALSPLWEIKRGFGEQFTNHLFELAPEKWEGPLRSPFGLHLVYVKEYRESRLPDLNEVQDEVKRDLMTMRQEKLKDKAYTKLKQKYTIVIEKPQDVTSSTTTKTDAEMVNR
jgi:hypothetical protein